MGRFEEYEAELLKKYNITLPGSGLKKNTGNSSDAMDAFKKYEAELMNKYSGSADKNEEVAQSAASGQTELRTIPTADEVRREQQKQQIYSQLGRTGITDKGYRLAETNRTAQQAEQARKEYDDYVAGEEYQGYLQEQRTPYAAGGAGQMAQVSTYAPGIEVQQKKTEDARETKAKSLKAVADYYENIARQTKDNQTLQDDMEEFESWPEEDREALKTYIINSNRENYDLTQGAQLQGAAWKSMALINKYGIGKVRQMAESYSRWENEQNSQAVRKAAEEAATGGIIKRATASLGSVAANALGNYTGIGGYAGEMAGRTGRYSTLDPNNVGQLPAVAAGSVRDKVAQQIEAGATGKVGSTLYKAGMSAADNFARMMIGMKNEGVTLGIAAAGTFGQTMSDASRQGASPLQATALATASSMFEVLTEKVSLDNLLKQAAGGKQTFKQILKSAMKAGGVEMSEEGMSFVLNQIADTIIMGGDSDFNRTIGELMVEEGMSYEQAREEASSRIMLEAAETLIVSGLSGGMMSGGTSMVTNTVESVSDDWNGRKKGAGQQAKESMIAGEGEVEGLSLPTPGVSIETTDRVKQKFIDQAGRLSRATGREIVFYSAEATENGIENGVFRDGKIYVNTRSGNALAQIVSHELTHSAEFADAYQDLSKAVFGQLQTMGADLQQLRQQKADIYAQNGHPLADQNAVDQEIVAEFVEQYLLSDADTILNVAAQNRTLGERIMGWIDSLLAKLGNKDAQERKFLTDARNLWAKAVEQSRSGAVPEAQNRTQQTDNRAVRENPAQTEEVKNESAREILEWARGEYAAGRMSEEDFDGIVEYAMQQEELEEGGEKFSISEIDGQNEKYGKGVVLDTNLFDGIRPRNWGKKLSDFVYKNLAGTELTMYNEQGKPETVVLARMNDRVKKNGADKSRKAIDELARYRGDNIRALATVHLSEMLETSKYKETTSEHSHQWLDENGWELRTAYITDRNGKIYKAILNIANARDGRRILYAINNIRQIDNRKKALPAAQVSSTESGGTRTTSRNASEDSLPNDSEAVKQQFSISATDKRGIANDLRSILNRGGDPAELRRYINSLEQGSGDAYQRGAKAEQNGAQRIIQAAKRSGISVEEYLRRNWEQYDVDGEWNADARQALEQERQGRRYSISPAEGQQGESEQEQAVEKKTAAEIREQMPAKARNYLEGAERKLLNGLGQKLGVSKFQNREKLQEIVREISDEYLTEGRINEEKMDFLFDRAYAEGIVQDWTFYNEHKEIKDHLKTTGVTLSKQDQSDIADFNDFRKRAFGTVRIVNNGIPVDSAYHELNQMAPGLFPESITHPADQLVRMYEIGRSIQVSEMSLQQFYGQEADTYRKWAKNDFSEVVNDTISDLRSVRRVAEEAARKAEEKQEAPTTPEEAAEAYKQLKDARKTYEKARAKNLLSDSDEIQVGRLLKGEIQLEHLDKENDNVKGITAVYEAKQEYERLTKLLAEYKRTVRQGYRDQADQALETANEWKDKKVGIAYSRETMERNIYDIVPDRKVAERVNREYFHPIHEAEAMSTRFKNEHRDLVRRLELSRKPMKGNLVSEAHAVQLLGEAEDNIRVLQNSRGRMKTRDGKTIQEWQAVIDDMWAQSPDLDQAKIRNAVSEFRKIYDKLFQQMNDVRIRNGYEPVNYRQGYFPHFQPGDGDGVLAHFGKVMGIDTQVAALPTTINGMTHTFKPGIQWFGNAQERLGFNTAYDAVEGFDKYIEGVASVIYQTENIQKLRALENQIRYRTTDEGIRKQVDAVNADTRLTEEEKQIKINSIYEHGKYTLSNFVVELSEYTNLLANKKSKLDRTMEGLIGRRAYTLMKAWESRVGANMIAGNISSALTNFIPLTQSGAQLSSDSMLKGMWNTLKSYKTDDGIPGMSTFLTNRRGSDPLVKTWAQNASEKLKMNVLMDLVDGFTSDSIVRAAYYQNLKQGLSEAEAMYQADLFAASVMADRSKGAMPTLFSSTNPVMKMFTQFQLEVNNQFSEMFKDLPRRHREKGLLVMTGVLMKYFIGAFLFNELYEFFAGRRPALDPISMLNDTVGDLTGYELPNVVEWITGEDVSLETNKVGVGQAAKNLASSALGELPFSSGLTMLGIETDGGRLPASSAVPDLTALWDAATTEGWAPEKRWKEAKDELAKLMYVVPPFGGNQVQKLWKGVKAYIEGGSYSVDKDGNDILQYPVYKDSPEDAFWSLVRAAFMGKSSLPEAQDWVESGFDSLGVKQTAVYQDMVAAGVVDREAYALLQELQRAQKTENQSRETVQCDILQRSDVVDDGKAVAFYGLLASDTERELMDSLCDLGASAGDAMYTLIDLRYGNQLKGTEKKQYQAKTLASGGLTDEAKSEIVGHILGKELMNENGNPTQYAKFLTATDRGLEVDQYMELRAAGADIEDYLSATDAGIRSDDAAEYALSLADLETKDDTTNIDKWRLSVDFSDKASDQLALLSLVMTESQLGQVELANSFDVKPRTYVDVKEILPKFDADKSGTYKQSEVQAALDSTNLSLQEKAVLWQLLNTSTKSAKNNPYSKEIGQKVLDAKG